MEEEKKDEDTSPPKLEKSQSEASLTSESKDRVSSTLGRRPSLGRLRATTRPSLIHTRPNGNVGGLQRRNSSTNGEDGSPTSPTSPKKLEEGAKVNSLTKRASSFMAGPARRKSSRFTFDAGNETISQDEYLQRMSQRKGSTLSKATSSILMQQSPKKVDTKNSSGSAHSGFLLADLTAHDSSLTLRRPSEKRDTGDGSRAKLIMPNNFAAPPKNDQTMSFKVKNNKVTPAGGMSRNSTEKDLDNGRGSATGGGFVMGGAPIYKGADDSSKGDSNKMFSFSSRTNFGRGRSVAASEAVVNEVLASQRQQSEIRKREDKIAQSSFDRDIFYGNPLGKTPAAEGEGQSSKPSKVIESYMHDTAAFRSHKTSNNMEQRAERNRLLALQRRASRNHSTEAPVNFYDVVEAESEPQSSTTDFSDRLAGKITESIHFQRFILFCIVLNTILSVLYTDPYFEQNYGRLIDQADSVFLTIFFLELALKMKFQKQGFWYDNWNLFDFSLILVSLLGTVVRDIGTRKTIGGRVLRFLRVLRAFRTLRILGALRNLQIVVNTFLKSLLELTNIIAMILLLMFMFSILGLQLFEPVVPEYFGSLALSFQSLFVMITQDGWVTIWAAIEEANEQEPQSTLMELLMHMYFIMFIVIGAWVFINIISGVTVTNWQLYVQEMKMLEKQRFHEIETTSLRTNFTQEAREIGEDNVDGGLWAKQIPLSSGSALERVSVEKLENYMLVLKAMEKNHKEYNQLKHSLFKHLDIVQQSNILMEVTAEEEPELEEELDNDFFDGDVLSMLTHLKDTGQNDSLRRLYS